MSTIQGFSQLNGNGARGLASVTVTFQQVSPPLTVVEQKVIRALQEMRQLTQEQQTVK